MNKNLMTYTFILILFLSISCSSDNNESVKVDHNSQISNYARPTPPESAYQVKIGNQIWMTRNLSVTHYRNGDIIPQPPNISTWWNLTSGACSNYNNNVAYNNTYGKLYNWYAINDPRGLAPEGWHIPTKSEFEILINYLGGESEAGGKMKSTFLWNTPNTLATNSSGFTALPGGFINYYNNLSTEIGSTGKWWSVSEMENFEQYAYNIEITNFFAQCRLVYTDKNAGYSVRCIKD
ncbi:MAG: fibrobacter succinogenes major paralogous domain-containing protein [Bacteroidetes bacterium]|nr:fibrobacter succinogenes major paralogous domain-containing protein [Bacteroidota bacterium]